MPTQNGTSVNFAFVATSSDKGITSTGVVMTAWLIQNTDLEGQAETEDVRALQGDVVARNHYDKRKHFTLRAIIAGASKAAAITATTLSGAEAGDFIVVTACASQPDLVATWEAQSGAKIVGDVTKSAEITIPLIKRAGITAAMS